MPKDFKACLIINFQTDNIGDSNLKVLNYQDLLDLVDGAAIFSAGGGGDPEGGYRIADKLTSQGYTVKLEEYVSIEKLASYMRS